jgi:ABC-type transport system involved in cytochrome bd biosynthesis fused ATPase/permease subunit
MSQNLQILLIKLSIQVNLLKNIFFIFSITYPPVFICQIDSDDIAAQLGDLDLAANHRAVTATLLSHPDCRDVQLGSLSITFHGAELLVDTKLELNCGRRYGLIGLNGCGKLCLKKGLMIG